MPKAIRITEENIDHLYQLNPLVFRALRVDVGDIFVARKYDFAMFNEKDFNDTYKFVGPEALYFPTEVRVLPKKQLLGKKGRRK